MGLALEGKEVRHVPQVSPPFQEDEEMLSQLLVGFYVSH